MMQKVNSYALRSFRDTADRDYIHARMAYRAELIPQFRWSALHSLEKYAKCISILLRIPRPKKYIKHEVRRSLNLISEKIEINISERTEKFIEKLEDFGARFRYLEVSWDIYEGEVAVLDRAVWEIRRYCNAGLYLYKENNFAGINPNCVNRIESLVDRSKDNTEIAGGFLEKTLSDKSSRARSDLVWCNLFYSSRNRKSVRIPTSMIAENSSFFLYPEIIDEVSKYAFIPNEIINAYKSG